MSNGEITITEERYRKYQEFESRNRELEEALEKRAVDYSDNLDTAYKTLKVLRDENKKLEAEVERLKNWKALHRSDQLNYACGHKSYATCGTCCDIAESKLKILREALELSKEWVEEAMECTDCGVGIGKLENKINQALEEAEGLNG